MAKPKPTSGGLYAHGAGMVDRRIATGNRGDTGIKRVETENLLEEYRDKLDAQKTIPGENQN